MNKKLRKRKIKVLMKIAIPEVSILQDGDQILNPEEPRNILKGTEPIPICDWNDSIILDLFGFVPYAGDAVDLGRSFVYLNCGKYLDATIGLICVIPVFGSALGLSLKALKKSGKVSDLREVFFESVDWVAKNLNIDDKLAYGRTISALEAISSEPRAFFKGLKEKNIEFVESMVSIEDNLKKFESYLNKIGGIDFESYKRWKKSSIESSNLSPDKISKTKRKKIDFSNSSKGMYNLAKKATSLPISIMMKGFDAILKRIHNGIYKSFFEIIKKERKDVEKYIDKMSFRDEIFDYAKEIDLPDELFEGMHRELNRFYEVKDIEKMKDILKKYENKKYDIHNMNNQEKLLGVSEKIAKSVSRNFDIFFMHCTSDSYIKMIQRNLSFYRTPPISYDQVSEMINSFFLNSSSTKTSIDVIKEMGDGWAGAAWDQYIEVIERSLDGHTISHELLHHFDFNFVKHIREKYKLSFPFDNISEMARVANPKDEFRTKMIKDSPSFNKIFFNDLKDKGVSFKGGPKGAGDQYSLAQRLEYISKPTEILSYFNDARSLMIDEAASMGQSIPYPSTEEVIEFALSENVSPIFDSFLDSLFLLKNKYGAEAYDIIGVEDKTGDFLLDFFSQYGV